MKRALTLAFLCLPGCAIFQETDTTAAIEALMQMNAEIKGKDRAIEGLVDATEHAMPAGLADEVRLRNEQSTEAYRRFSALLEELLEEYGRVDWSEIAKEGLEVYRAARNM